MESCHDLHRHRGRVLMAVALCLAAAAALVMILWNALLPQIFALPAVGYWQALGLIVLARLLLGVGPRPWHARAWATCKRGVDPGAPPEGPVAP